jgi:hypothetical protein
VFIFSRFGRVPRPQAISPPPIASAVIISDPAIKRNKHGGTNDPHPPSGCAVIDEKINPGRLKIR